MSITLIATLAACTAAIVILGGFSIWLSYRSRSRPIGNDRVLASELADMRESIEALRAEVHAIAESQRVTERILKDATSMRATFPPHSPKAVTH